VTQGARCRPAGINPSPKRHDHRRQVGRRFAVELYMVMSIPLGSDERRSALTLCIIWAARAHESSHSLKQLPRPHDVVAGLDRRTARFGKRSQLRSRSVRRRAPGWRP